MAKRPPPTTAAELLAVLLPKGLGTASKSAVRKAAKLCRAVERRLTRRLTQFTEMQRASSQARAAQPTKPPGDPFYSDTERKQAIRKRWLR